MVILITIASDWPRSKHVTQLCPMEPKGISAGGFWISTPQKQKSSLQNLPRL